MPSLDVNRIGTVWICALLLLPASCGYGSGGGDTVGSLVGGTLRPNETAYALTPSSDSVVGGEGDADPLPCLVDLRRDGIIPPVQNQRWNSCVAWSLGYYIMTAVEARRALEADPSLDLDIRDPANWFAPDFIYSQRDSDQTRRNLTGKPPDCVELDGEIGCMRPEKALRILVTQGCCHWNWMCGDGSSDAFRSCSPDGQSPTLHKSRRAWGPATIDGARNRPRCYVRFGALDTFARETIDDMRAWLDDERTPIAIVVKMRTGWVNYRGENRVMVDLFNGFAGDLFEERGVCLEASGSELFSQHMMTIIGYDDEFPSDIDFPDLPEEKRGSFLVVNQWGEKWGDRGTMWIPYSELAEIWIGGYGIVAGDGPNAPPRGVECAQDDQGRWVNIVECNDVPENLDANGTPMPTADVLTPGVVHVDEVGHVITDGTCASSAGGTPVKGRDFADWFQFETTGEATRVELELTGEGGAPTGDLDLRLIDEDERHIVSALGGGAGNVLITRTLCAQGLYRLKVFPNGANDQSRYRLTLRFLPPGPGEPDDDICGAQEIGIDEVVGDDDLTLDTRQDADNLAADTNPVDWWKLTAVGREQPLIVLAGHFGQVLVMQGETSDTAVPVFDIPAIQPIVLGDLTVDVGFFISFFPFSIVEGECIWIAVHDSPLTANASQIPLRYELLLDAVPVQRDDQKEGATEIHLERAPPGDVWCGASDPDEVSKEDRSDWYLVRVPDASELTVTLEGTDANANLTMEMSGGTPGLMQSPPNTIMQSLENPPFNGTTDFFIQVSSRDGRPPAPYELFAELTIDGTKDDLRENSNGNTIQPGESREGIVGEGDDVDWFRYNNITGDPDELLLTLTDFSETAPPPTLAMSVDPFGDVALVDRNSASNRLRMQGSVPAGGTIVWIGVSVSSTAPLTDYTLHLSRVPASPTSVDGNDTPPTATVLADGVAHAETVGGADPLDFLRLEIPDGTSPVSVTVTLDDLDAGKQLGLSVWNAASTATATDLAPGVVNNFTVQPGTDVMILVDGSNASSAYRVRATISR